MAMKCFECEQPGHIAADCPNREMLNGGKPWCGICDQQTHLVGSPEGLKRCPDCHPKRHELRRPLRRCHACRQTIYEWDNSPCGHHQAPHATDQRLSKDQIDHIMEGK